MTWQAYLKGDAFDLDTLTHLFPIGDVRVQRDAEGVFGTGPMLDATTSAGDALRVAKEWLPMLNSAARVSLLRPTAIPDRGHEDRASTPPR